MGAAKNAGYSGDCSNANPPKRKEPMMATLEPKITYTSTPEEIEAMHDKFDAALEEVERDFGKDYPMIINGQDRSGGKRFDVIAPAHTSTVLGTFPKGSNADVDEAVEVAEVYQPEWA